MISADTVTRTWQRCAATPPHEARRLIEQMRREQPVILAYLLAMSEQPEFGPDDRDTVSFIGIAVWQIMKQGSRRLRRVTEHRLDDVLDANHDLLEKLAGSTQTGLCRAVKASISDYPEPEVLRYIVEALREDGDDAGKPALSEAAEGLAFLTLKNILDALVFSMA